MIPLFVGLYFLIGVVLAIVRLLRPDAPFPQEGWVGVVDLLFAFALCGLIWPALLFFGFYDREDM